jgi:hypothetical protein
MSATSASMPQAGQTIRKGNGSWGAVCQSCRGAHCWQAGQRAPGTRRPYRQSGPTGRWEHGKLVVPHLVPPSSAAVSAADPDNRETPDKHEGFAEADGGTRTPDPIITSDA